MSLKNKLLYLYRQTKRHSRQGYHEKPAQTLTNLTPYQNQIIPELKKTYRISFEDSLNHDHSLENYHVLDVLHQSAKEWHWEPPRLTSVIDAGSANFFYAPALSHFLKPSKLTGIEIDGYWTYADGHSRYDYAQFYCSQLPHTEYIVEDFCQSQRQAQIVTYFYPFVSKDALIDWSLPSSLFNPQNIFDAVVRHLEPGGFFFMVNNGESEFELAKKFCQNSQLTCVSNREHSNCLTDYPEIPITSLWRT